MEDDLRKLDAEIARAEREADRRRQEADERIVELLHMRAQLEAALEATRDGNLDAEIAQAQQEADRRRYEAGEIVDLYRRRDQLEAQRPKGVSVMKQQEP
jgi:hypothetical protein